MFMVELAASMRPFLASEKKMINEQKSYWLRASLEVLEKMGRGDGVLAKALRDAIEQPAQSREMVVTAAMFGSYSRPVTDPL